MLGMAFVAVGSLRQCFAGKIFCFHPSGSPPPPSCADVLASCGDFFGSSTSWGFPFFFLPSFRRAGGGRSRDALRLLPEGLPLLPLDFCPVRGVEEPLVARFCLLGSFVDWGSRSCSLAADSCYPICPGWFSLLISARSAR